MDQTLDRTPMKIYLDQIEHIPLLTPEEEISLGEKVQAGGDSQELGPLNPYARRIVHMAVSENPAVTTESLGDDFMKVVIISLKR